MGHFGEVGDDGAAAHITAQRDGQTAALERLAVFVGLQQAAQGDDAGLGVGHLDTDHGASGDGRFDADGGRGESEGEVVGEAGDAVDADAGAADFLGFGDRLAVIVEQRLAVCAAHGDLAGLDLPARLDTELGDAGAAVDFGDAGVDTEGGEGVDDDLRALVGAGGRDGDAVGFQQFDRRQPPAVGGLALERAFGGRRLRFGRGFGIGRGRRRGRRRRRGGERRRRGGGCCQRGLHGPLRGCGSQFGGLFGREAGAFGGGASLFERRPQRCRAVAGGLGEHAREPAGGGPGGGAERGGQAGRAGGDFLRATLELDAQPAGGRRGLRGGDQERAAEDEQDGEDRAAFAGERSADGAAQRVLGQRDAAQRGLRAECAGDAPEGDGQSGDAGGAAGLDAIRLTEPQQHEDAAQRDDQGDQVEAAAERGDERAALVGQRRAGH